MAAIEVNVTDFSRGLSDFLNQVQYKGQTLDIARGKRVIARLSPAVIIDGFPISQLDDLLNKGSPLSTVDRVSMANDVNRVRSQLSNRSLGRLMHRSLN